MPRTVVIAFGAALLLYALFVLGLLVAGRRRDARAWAGFAPDCLVLFKRLMQDRRVSRGCKALLLALIAYLALPLDLIPDFIPVVGQLDNAIIVAVVLRSVLRGSGPTSCASTGPDRRPRCERCCDLPAHPQPIDRHSEVHANQTQPGSRRLVLGPPRRGHRSSAR